MDNVEAIVEVAEYEQEGLGFGDEAVDFRFHGVGVLGVLVEDGRVGKLEGLEGSKELISEKGGNGASGLLLHGDAV